MVMGHGPPSCGHLTIGSGNPSLGARTMAIWLSNSGEAKRSTQQARGEQNDGGYQRKDSMDRDPNQPERQQQKPHDGIEDQGQQGQGQHRTNRRHQSRNASMGDLPTVIYACGGKKVQRGRCR